VLEGCTTSPTKPYVIRIVKTTAGAPHVRILSGPALTSLTEPRIVTRRREAISMVWPLGLGRVEQAMERRRASLEGEDVLPHRKRF
jgi:hypothetical protein